MCVRTTRRWRSAEEEEEERRNPRITKESLRRMCKEQKLYITPDLNDVLYLHYKGYSKIENLDEYTGLKCLWLENNGIDKIENLDNQKDLRSLYLHNNLIKEIENLEGACPLLDSLNLCHNSVSRIQNLSKLEHLHTLQISHNRLQDFADVEHLKECKELSCVDLQHNWLDDPTIVDIFEAMPSLRVLYLTGNPVVKKIPFYRKNLTVRCKKLTYLDDRPVFPKDRAAAEAWSEGGLEAEKACRQKWAEDERAKIDASVKGLLALRDKAKAEKFKEEMERLEPRTESEKEVEEEQKEEDEEEENEEGEESGSESEPAGENLEAGDSEEITHNGIIFPWDLETDSRTRNRNELGEGGRSLIVELPDPNETETKSPKSVKKKSLQDPEMKIKLHEALLSAEWLKENTPAGNKPQEEEPTTAMEAPAETPFDEMPSSHHQTSAASSPETKSLQENILQDEEEIEKGALDNLVKEKELAYHKYLAKTEAEILPNISHFAFGQDAKPPEKSLSTEIEELLKIEKEESRKAKMDSDEETRKENRKKLIEEIQEKEKFALPAEENEMSRQSEHALAKNLVRTEVDGIIRHAITLLDEKHLINEEEANEVLDNGVKVVDELNSIGRLPLKEKHADVQRDSPPSSDDEFHDVNEELGLTFSEQFSLVGGEGKNKLEPQQSDEYYSLLPDGEEEGVDGVAGQVQNEEEKTDNSPEEEAEKGEEDTEKGEEDAEKGEEDAEKGEEDTEKGEEDAEKGEEDAEKGEEDAEKGEEDAEKGEEDAEKGKEKTEKGEEDAEGEEEGRSEVEGDVEHEALPERESLEESSTSRKKNITSSIELQIVSEADAE